MKIVTACTYYDKKSQKVWIVHSKVNALFVLSLLDNTIQFVTKFDGYDKTTFWEIKKIIERNNCLFFFSATTNDVWTMDKNTWHIRKRQYGSRHHIYIKDVVLEENNVWIIPTLFNNPIISIDLDSWILHEESWENQKWEGLDKNSFTEAFDSEDGIYFFSRKVKNIALFHVGLHPFCVDFLRLESIENIGCAPLKLEEYFWALGRKTNNEVNLCKFDVKGRIYESITLNKIKIYENSVFITFSKMCVYENRIILLPAMCEYLVVFDMLSKEIVYIDLGTDLSKLSQNKCECMIFEYAQKEYIFYLFSERFPFIIIFNVLDYSYKLVNVKDDNFNINLGDYGEMNGNKDFLFKEDVFWGLNEYLKGIGEMNDSYNK